MNSEDERSIKSNDNSLLFSIERFDDEEELIVTRDQIRSPSEQVGESKSSDTKGTDRLRTAYKASFRSSKERLPSADENVAEARQNYIDPDDSVRNQSSFNEQVADFVNALINQNRVMSGKIEELINENRVVNNKIEDIKKQFMIFSTHGFGLEACRREDTDQLGLEENTKNESLVPDAFEESAQTGLEKASSDSSVSLNLASALDESTPIQNPSCLIEDQPSQPSRPSRISTEFRSFNFGKEIPLEPDIYSIFIVSRNWAPRFLFSLIVALSQFAIIALMLIDLLQRRETNGDQTLHIPPKVGWPVVITQCFSLVIAFITVDDMMVSLKMLVIGYDPDIEIKNPAASYRKFLIGNMIRFCEGFCTVAVCFVVIVQSSEVLQLFMDFAAVSFVSQLDNMAFKLAEEGFVGERLKKKCETVRATKVKAQRNARFGLINLIFLLVMGPFLTVFVAVRAMQTDGTLLGQYACEHLNVEFGDEILVFDENVRFRFVGEGFNKTFANSIRTLPQVDETPAEMPYQFFSGHYVAEKIDFDRLEEYYGRPVYWETIKNPSTSLSGDHSRGEMLKDPTSGKFYYCGSKSSWVFTIEALFDTPGVMPQQAKDECEWGWLMLSPPTQAITLNDAPMEGWNIWTGSIELSTPEFSISCEDCRRNEDCGLTHGFCDLESRTCNCYDDWQGSRCQAERPFCPGITWVNEGGSSREYSQLRPISNLWNARTYYDRPLYFSPMTTEQKIDIWTNYAGRRWWVTHFDANYLMVLGNFPHAYWDNNLHRVVKYSDPTTSYYPTGLKWNERERTRSTGNFGPFGASFPAKGRYECIQVDCMNNRNVCGRYGSCVTRTEVVNEIEGLYNQCECSNYTGGYFCEHPPEQPYAMDMYREYIANPASYRKNNPEIEYLKFWANETGKANVGV